MTDAFGVSKAAKLPRLRRVTINQPHNNDMPDIIIWNGRALRGEEERMAAMSGVQRAARKNRFFSPYRVTKVPASGGAEPMQPTGKGARKSSTVYVERKKLRQIPAVQVGAAGGTAGGVGLGGYALKRKKEKKSK